MASGQPPARRSPRRPSVCFAVAQVEGQLHDADPTTTCTNSAATTPSSTSSAAPRPCTPSASLTSSAHPCHSPGPSEERARRPALPRAGHLALLMGAAVTGSDLPGETVTPTGAALLHAAGARYGPPPPMTLCATGYGAGTRRLPDRPNVVSVSLGAPLPSAPDEDVVVLETNLDDVTGELLGHVITRAMDAGALDAWTTPAVMKKGRPAQILHVLTTRTTNDGCGIWSWPRPAPSASGASAQHAPRCRAPSRPWRSPDTSYGSNTVRTRPSPSTTT